MKILLFSDLHAHTFRAYATLTAEGVNSRLQDALNVLQQIKKIALQNKVDGILFGGDLFHIRPGLGSMKIPTFNAVYEAIHSLSKSVNFMGMLVGNHDQGNKAGTEHAIYAFSQIVTVMSRRGWYQFYSNDESISVFAVPATTEYSSLKKTLAELKELSEPKILLGHLGIDGAVVGSNFTLADSNLCKIKDLRPDYFDRIFLGDYHKPQTLSANACYIGATHQHNWGDEGQSRGCILWDTESDVVSFYCLAAPKFVKCDVAEWSSLPEESVSDCFVRIMYDQPISSAKQEEITEAILAKKARSVEFFQKQKEDHKLADSTKIFHPSMDQASMIRAYIDAEEPEDLDLDILLSIGHAVLAKASDR